MADFRRVPDRVNVSHVVARLDARTPGRSQRARRALGAVLLAACTVAAACGGTSATDVSGPSGIRCTAAIAPEGTSLSADGGRAILTVDAARECAWTARADAPWLQVTPTSGQGAGTLVVTAASNPSPSPRTGMVLVNDQPIAVSQSARQCGFELRPTSLPFAAEGGAGRVAVRVEAGCGWQPAASEPWVRLQNDARTGPGTLEFEVAPNPGAAREAVIRIADQAFTIVQGGTGAPPPVGPQPDLPAPANLAARVLSDSRVDLSWGSAAADAQTEVYRNGALVATLNAGVTTHQDTGLTRTVEYAYFVRHVRNGVRGASSNTVVARPAFLASGGAVSSAGGYRQHLFTSSGTFVVSQGGTIDEIIIVGGGGGGGGSEAGTQYGSGGGGAGGLRVIALRSEAAGTYTVTIGGGGAGGGSGSSNPANNNGGAGGPSSFAGEIVFGGGGGAGAGTNFVGNPGISGASGGGGTAAAGGAGIPGDGHAGGSGAFNVGGAAGGGGGGGKGGAGGSANGGNGGSGGAGFSTWLGMLATGGNGGRGSGGHGEDGAVPGAGGHGNDAGGSGGQGATGAVLIRYRQ